MEYVMGRTNYTVLVPLSRRLTSACCPLYCQVNRVAKTGSTSSGSTRSSARCRCNAGISGWDTPALKRDREGPLQLPEKRSNYPLEFETPTCRVCFLFVRRVQ